MFFVSSMAETVNIVLPQTKNNRVEYAAEYLQKQLQKLSYDIVVTTGRREKKAAHHVTLSLATDNAGKKEGFTINTTIKGKKKPHAYTEVIGNDGTGCIYGCDELAAQLRNKSFTQLPATISDAPEMVLRGGCIGVQKPYLLPGRQVYEYPYTPELFPWFYDKQQWIEYLDMLVANRMNSVYLWNGHPFASLVKLADYPFAVEVDDATFEKNKEIFAFLTNEADRRGIFVIQMFYNILVSKPFAEHYGIKTQDRHRPITPLLHDYTYKSVKAFIENYPNVGLLVCLGEAMDTYEDDVEWMTKTIIPAVKDGLKSLGRTDEPPVLLRAHDTNCEMVMQASLPLYKNLYTMNKYNGDLHIMAPHLEVEHPDAKRHVAFTRGPLLLAADQAMGVDPAGVVDFDLQNLTAVPAEAPYPTQIALALPLRDGGTVTLVDYASAGKTWKTKIAAWIKCE